ncbi:hypothetical protein [Burkholderia mallei]|uniref:EscU/YscU/HrcU family type III secretion system export apparatus switch protein n=1 Tax=Burkholderia mallei TaxID=13373 RepID=UPI003082136B
MRGFGEAHAVFVAVAHQRVELRLRVGALALRAAELLGRGEMVSLLMQVDLDARIPPQLYQAVAELLAWLYALERDAGDGGGAQPAFPPLPKR